MTRVRRYRNDIMDLHEEIVNEGTDVMPYWYDAYAQVIGVLDEEIIRVAAFEEV